MLTELCARARVKEFLNGSHNFSLRELSKTILALLLGEASDSIVAGYEPKWLCKLLGVTSTLTSSAHESVVQVRLSACIFTR